VSVATPLAFVVTGEPTTLPAPAVTANVTPTPWTGMPWTSRTITEGGSETFVPTAADCVTWDTAVIDTGVDATPVAVNVTDATPGDEAVNVLAPGIGPRNHPPTVAVPVASVVWREPTRPWCRASSACSRGPHRRVHPPPRPRPGRLGRVGAER
jgi:hypothetical protein